jgi:hypothetical protein
MLSLLVRLFNRSNLVKDGVSRTWQCLQADKGAELAQAIIAGEAIAVSGSFKEEYGTTGWTLRGHEDAIFMTGVNVTPGVSSAKSAFHSELSGLYGMETAV